jgi:hypothetical protein
MIENRWFAGAFLIEKLWCAGSAERRSGSDAISADRGQMRGAKGCSVFIPPYSIHVNKFQEYCLSIPFEWDGTSAACAGSGDREGGRVAVI